MKVQKTKSGRIMLLTTLSTMEVGEKWKIDPLTYKTATLRVTCSNYGAAVNKVFTVNSPADAKKIIITRTR
ncbi:MAG: hypothetical protein KBS78_07400 [Bacteroidales bacterium]|nr:hypothetical protein [Candidatus Cryptobacteroides faecihippi]